MTGRAVQIGAGVRDIVHHVPTIVLAAAGGWILSLADAPLPWFFGALFTIAGCNLAGLSVRGPRGSRQLGQIFVGTTIGLYFTPVVGAIVLAQLPWMLLVAVVLIGFGGIGGWFLGRFARLDRATVFFGNVPGGMAEMMELGDRYGAEPVALTLSQLTRVTIVVLTIPPALTLLGRAGDEVFIPLAGDVDLPWLAVLLVSAATTACLLHRLRMTNAWMLGSALFVASLTLIEIRLSAMPRELLSVAQVLIGIALGERFSRSAMASAPRVIIGSGMITIVMMVVAVFLAVVISDATAIPVTALIAATAPGGLAEMSLTAAVLKLGVPLVTAYHIIRVILITLLVLPAYRLGLFLFPVKSEETA